MIKLKKREYKRKQTNPNKSFKLELIFQNCNQ